MQSDDLRPFIPPQGFPEGEEVRRLILAFALTLAVGAGIGGGLVHATTHTAPRCQYEDEVLVGVGDYSHGYWTDYVCQNLD